MATKTIKIGLSDADKAAMTATIKGNALGLIADAYSTSGTYAVGDLVYYNNVLYKCKTAISTAESWTAAHWEATSIEEESKNKLSKGDFDGTTGVGYADVADNLTPYSDDSGAFQSEPFVSQGTGTDNNTAIVTTGNYAQLREKQGNTLAWNQQFSTSGSTQTLPYTNNGITYSLSNGKIVLNGTATANSSLTFGGKNIIKDHYYLRKNLKSNGFSMYGTYELNDVSVVKASANDSYLTISVKEGAVVDNYQYDGFAIDLTQLFGPGKEPSSVTDPRVIWAMNYALQHPAYDAGSLINSDGVKLVCTGRNLINGQLIEMGTINESTGANITITNGQYWRYSDYILVTPNSEYYIKLQSAYTTSNDNMTLYCYDRDKNYIGTIKNCANGHRAVPSNCVFVRPTWYLVNATQTITTDADLSLYYPPEQGGEGYDKHYPYEEPHVVDTGSEVLRSARDVRDGKAPNGTITRKVKPDTLQSFSWTYNSSLGLFFASVSGVAFVDNSTAINATSDKYGVKSFNDVYAKTTDKTICYASDGRFYLYDSSLNGDASLISGDINYELATPTTKQGTAYPENVTINDYGMMYWLNASDELVSVPQGSKFFYPVNYKGFTDDLYARTDGDASDVVIQSELTASETARDAVDAQLKEALGGTLRQLLALKTNIDFDDTAWVDLGELSWSRSTSGSNPFFFATISNIKSSAVGNTYKALNTKLVQVNPTAYADINPDITLQVRNQEVQIRDDSYTDAATFKAAMKNVLLAYEKA